MYMKTKTKLNNVKIEDIERYTMTSINWAYVIFYKGKPIRFAGDKSTWVKYQDAYDKIFNLYRNLYDSDVKYPDYDKDIEGYISFSKIVHDKTKTMLDDCLDKKIFEIRDISKLIK